MTVGTTTSSMRFLRPVLSSFVVGFGGKLSSIGRIGIVAALSSSSDNTSNSLVGFQHLKHLCKSETRSSGRSTALFSMTSDEISAVGSTINEQEKWDVVLAFKELPHRSVKIIVDDSDQFDKTTFTNRLKATIEACKQLNKSSIWVEVPITKASLIEDLAIENFKLHHADDNGLVANLYLWLSEGECKIPTFATHQVGVGAVVVNSRDEVLVVRELRKNYLPWKIPGGLAELGEHIDEAVAREVFEETGIKAEFQNVLSMRHNHGAQFNRSDLYFVCRLKPAEQIDDEGNVFIPEPVADASEISAVKWLPLSEFRVMVNEHHPMMQQIMKLYDSESSYLERSVLKSVVPGRKPSPIYHGRISEK